MSHGINLEFSNYKQPTITAGPNAWSVTVTGTSKAQAEAIAKQHAETYAKNAYGENTTEFVSFPEIQIRLNSAGEIPNNPGIVVNRDGQELNSYPNVIETGSPAAQLMQKNPTYTVTYTTSAVQYSNETESGFPPPERTAPPVTQQDVQNAIDRENGAAADAAASTQDTPDSTTSQSDEAQGADPYAEIQNNQSRLQTVTTTGKKLIEAPKNQDWRFRIHLSRDADYLYKDPGIRTDDLLFPLRDTHGVIFPYNPTIGVTYTASYDAPDLTHTNYKIYSYRNSSVENINIMGDFTAQDTYEANYLLAVIHFFRSVTKMFYGKDQSPIRGTPPPLCYLSGFGDYAFNEHPVVITSFTLNYPADVDYINAGLSYGGQQGLVPYNPPVVTGNPRLSRLRASNLQPGGGLPIPKFNQGSGSTGNSRNTRVPTKVQLQLSCLPVVTRDRISNDFSLKDYATGKLMLGNRLASSYGGMW